MSRALALALLALTPIGAQACNAEPSQPPARSYETGVLTIAGTAFATNEIADARAMPDINKKVGVMVSLTEAGAKRLEALSGTLIGKPMPVMLDGKPLSTELIRKPIANGVIEIPGRWTLDVAETLARRISGKDPLPDDLAF